MNLQRLIDQHPSVFALIFPVYFLFLWLLVGAVISFIGGWFSLAQVYRTQEAFDGSKWRMQSGDLASMFLFRFMHPPLLVPWSEIKVRRSDKPC